MGIGKIHQDNLPYGMTNVKGFTLVEVLLSLAVIAILAGILTPSYQTFQIRNDLDIASHTILQSARRTQLLSQAVDGDANWGIFIQTGSITLFKGTSYLTRDTGFDELFEVPTSITPSGISEIVFAKFTGDPQQTGQIILTSSANETRTITINEKGTAGY